MPAPSHGGGVFLQTNIEILREEDFTKILEIEEQYIQQICADIIKLKPDVVITEKGVSGWSAFSQCESLGLLSRLWLLLLYM